MPLYGVWSGIVSIIEKDLCVEPLHQIIYRMIFFTCKSEQPVTCSKGWDMCLINTADLESAGNPFMAALHGMCIFCIKRASCWFTIIQSSFRCIVTVSVKFTGKQSFRRTKRIRGIHDDKIIFCFTSSDKSQFSQ